MTKTSRNRLRLLGTVGEPINPEAWQWYSTCRRQALPDRRHLVADRDRRHHDHAAARRHRLKPGSATRPFFGVEPELVDARASCSRAQPSGNLCIADSWPGQMRTVYGDHERFVQTYFSTYQGKYFTGDGCRRDEDGYYWITGRVDDVINVSGHRLGTAEVETRWSAHAKVAEAAVVGYPARHQGPGHLLLRDADGRRDGLGRLAQGTGRAMCARRSARSPRRTRSSSRPACPRRARARSCAASCARSPRTISRAGRHLDAGRSGGGRGSDQQPAEQARQRERRPVERCAVKDGGGGPASVRRAELLPISTGDAPPQCPTFPSCSTKRKEVIRCRVISFTLSVVSADSLIGKQPLLIRCKTSRPSPADQVTVAIRMKTRGRRLRKGRRPFPVSGWSVRCRAGSREISIAASLRQHSRRQGAVDTLRVHRIVLGLLLVGPDLEHGQACGPKLCSSGTSVASRPRATTTRPMRGMLWRGSKVYHLPSR